MNRLRQLIAANDRWCRRPGARAPECNQGARVAQERQAWWSSRTAKAAADDAPKRRAEQSPRRRGEAPTAADRPPFAPESSGLLMRRLVLTQGNAAHHHSLHSIRCLSSSVCGCSICSSHKWLRHLHFGPLPSAHATRWRDRRQAPAVRRRRMPRAQRRQAAPALQ